MKNFKYILSCLLLTSLAIGFQACKKNPERLVNEVVFTDSVKSYTVTFKNTTADAKSFRWDFGDSTSSTETNPVHTYAAKGKHVVTLYATLNNGNVINGSTIIHVSKSSPIVLTDNTLADWDTISNIVIPPSLALGGVVKETKFDYDSQNIYIYMKLAVHVADANVFDFYLDSDDNFATGLTTGSIPGGGYDFLLEGNMLSDPNSLIQYQHDDSKGQTTFGGAFNPLSIANFFTLGTVQEANGITTFEMSLSRSKISGLTGSAMKLAIIVSDSGYNNIGWMPANGSAPVTLDISQ
jgi:PKD repeat protein